MSSPPECGPAAVATAPVTTSTEAGRDADRGHEPPPARTDGAADTSEATPRLERDDDGEPDDDEREQEVRHHEQRVEVEDHRDPAERDLRDGAEKAASADQAHPAPADPPHDATRAT